MNEKFASSVQQAFGARVAEVRARRGLRQEDLAQLLDEAGYEALADATKINRIESGKRGLSLNEAFAIAAALNVSPVLLFAPLGDSDMVAITPNLSLPAAVLRAWVRAELWTLRDTDRSAIEALAEFPAWELKKHWRRHVTPASPIVAAVRADELSERVDDLSWEIQEGEFIRRGTREQPDPEGEFAPDDSQEDQ